MRTRRVPRRHLHGWIGGVAGVGRVRVRLVHRRAVRVWRACVVGVLWYLRHVSEDVRWKARWNSPEERERRLALKPETAQASYVWLRWEVGMGECSDDRMVPGRLACGYPGGWM